MEVAYVVSFLFKIWRAISETKGLQGIYGLYKDDKIILKNGEKADPWEGLQGIDSFFSFKVKDKWIARVNGGHINKK
ncbi:MAG: hypothetical protein HC880_18425 [Bacteroidia bacterium]|nr:hypothetical protein [Bacteroidia bacterium]